MRASDVALWSDEYGDDDWLLGEVLPVGGGRGPVVFGNGTPLQVNVFLALGADLTADPSTWTWTDVTGYARYESGVTARTGREDESSRVGPGSGSLTFDNSDGRFSRRNPTGPYWGLLSRNTPILVTANAGPGAYSVLTQYVNEWPARMNTPLTDFTVPIRTGGILRRLGQGDSLSWSALRRAISGDADLVQYWACEDGTDAHTLASAVSAGSALAMLGTVAPGTSTAAGIASDPLPVLSTGTTYLRGETGMGSAREWTYSATFYFTSVPVFTSGDGTAYLLYCPASQSGTLVRWLLYWNDADNTVYLEVRSNSAVVSTIAGPVLTNSEMVNCWLTFWVSAKQNGSNVDYAFGVERTTTSGVSSAATSGTINTQTVYQLDGMLIFNGKSAASTTVGHAFVLSRALTATQNTPAYQAVNGWVGETATARLTRLTAEQGVPFVIPSGIASEATMGAQSRGSFLDALRECEATDGGVLYEEGFGLGYQPLAARYNVAPALALTLSGGYVAAEPEPTDDDQQLRNRWTITRDGGTEATVQDDASITSEGLYADAATVSLESDDQAGQVAAWRVHLGTVDDLRWPSISLRFDNTAGSTLIPAWIDMPYGQRITFTNPPYQVSPTGEPVDVIVEGRVERVDSYTWVADLYTSPARSYRVFEVEHDLYGRAETDGSTLEVAVDSDDTSLTIATTGYPDTPVWTPNAEDWPFDIEIGGEQMRVTAVAASSSPQTFTVTRSVNGVVKSHTAGAAVTLWQGAVLAL